MKFRVRKDTNFLYIHLRNTGGLTLSELHRDSRRAGKLTVDYHYIVQESGLVEEGRRLHEIAGNQLENAETSIYILVDIGGSGKQTDAQKVIMKELIEELSELFPDAQLIISKE